MSKDKKLTVVRMCRRCNGNIYEEINHNCNKSLFKRGMKFATNPPKNGNIVHMTKEEVKNYKPEPAVIVEDPKDVKAGEKFLEVCGSVAKQLESAKNEKELSAISERFTKALDKFKKTKPSTLPEIVEVIEKKVEELKESFTKK